MLVPTSATLSPSWAWRSPPNKAIVGANAFAHEAGIHQDGMLKNELTYEIMRPESVGAPGTRLVLGKHSGMRGLDARCRALGHRLRQPELERLYTRVTALADRTKSVDDDQLAVDHPRGTRGAAVVGRRAAHARTGRRGMSLKIALLPGDGIGPEVTAEAVRILKAVADARGQGHHVLDAPDRRRRHRPRRRWPARATRSRPASASQAVLLGRRGPSEATTPSRRPSGPRRRCSRCAQALGGFANLRPAVCYAPLARRTPFQPERVRGANILIVRELLGGLYFGEPRGYAADGQTAFNTLIYSRAEVERVARVAFDLARKRRGRLASIDKANVLEVSRLWRAVGLARWPRTIPRSRSSTSTWTPARCAWPRRRPAST